MEKVEQGFGFVELLEDNNMDVVGLLNLEEKKENNYNNMFLELPPPLPYSCYTRMVCFGGEDMFVGGLKGSTCGGSETSSSTSSSSNNAIPKAKGRGGRLGLGTNNGTANGSKKPRKGQQNKGSINVGATKVRKEKLGDRIVALQQLVSPFGKSDTASVLHEAMCYIKFLHDQVQVLSSPYLQQQQLTSETAPPQRSNGEESRMGLRRRGLCLVPISSTVHVAGTNGADLWSPAIENNNCDTRH